jgi:hypothetical protein
VLTAAPNQRAEILDVREVLSKPVTITRLLETVERHI